MKHTNLFILMIILSVWLNACATSSSPKEMSAKDEARFAAAIDKADAENPPKLQPGDTITVSIGESAAADPAVHVTAPQPEAKPVSAEPARAFNVSRADYDAFFAQSPAIVLGRLTLEPIQDGITLLGYRIKDIKSFEGVDLQKEDIIVGLDGKMPRTPDAYFESWQAAKAASKCTVNIQRGTDRFDLVWTVTE